MKTKATINLSFMLGTNIKDAFTEAIRIAKIMDVFCEFTFNKVTCCTSASGSPEKGVEAYEVASKSDYHIKIAFA